MKQLINRLPIGNLKNLVIFLVIASLILSGCEILDMFAESEQSQVKSAGDEWMEVHGLRPTNPDGTINTDGAAEVIKRLVTDSSGDPEVDAALGSDNAIAKIREADRLNDRGWEMRDTAYVTKAIKLRPEDWKYRISRATLNIDIYNNPKWNVVDGDFEAAENLAGIDKNDRIAYAQYGIERMEALKKRLTTKPNPSYRADLWVQPRVCRTVFNQLAHYYNVLADQTGRSDYRELAEQNTRDLSLCPED